MSLAHFLLFCSFTTPLGIGLVIGARAGFPIGSIVGLIIGLAVGLGSIYSLYQTGFSVFRYVDRMKSKCAQELVTGLWYLAMFCWIGFSAFVVGNTTTCITRSIISAATQPFVANSECGQVEVKDVEKHLRCWNISFLPEAVLVSNLSDCPGTEQNAV